MKLSRGLSLAAAGAVAAVAVRDLTQTERAILHNYPVVGHLRYLLNDIRPEVQQYFIERNWDGRPFNRDVRSMIEDRARGRAGDQAFGTELDVYEVGYEYLVHSAMPVPVADEVPKVRIGGPDCGQPYDMALLNVSAMSFGALSANAIRALNLGAALGGFAHDTGEGGISPYHREYGGDLVWEIGTGYFGCRTPDGRFDPQRFADVAADPAVKAVSIKLSQGAKPGIGGVLPGPKVTPEIAAIREVPVGITCISPPAHSAFSTPVELIEYIAQLRELTGGKPIGFKLCVGSRVDLLAMGKAMLEVGTAPDFIVVDGSEGGTGAAPPEFEDHVGMPLTHGLMMLHNVLVGLGLRDRLRIGAAGKVAASNDIVKRIIQGADYTNAARAMMMATGCIQAQRCHTGKCPTGVATQSAWRQRGLVVADKSEQVRRFQEETVAGAMRLMAAMGVTRTDDLGPTMLRQHVSATRTRSYAEIYEWLEPGELLANPPKRWKADLRMADASRFHHPTGR